MARRLLRVMTGQRRSRGVATLGRATLEAGKHAGPLLEVLDEAARLKVNFKHLELVSHQRFHLALVYCAQAVQALINGGSD